MSGSGPTYHSLTGSTIAIRPEAFCYAIIADLAFIMKGRLSMSEKEITIKIDQDQIDTLTELLDGRENSLFQLAAEAYADGNIPASVQYTNEANHLKAVRRQLFYAWSAGGAA